MSELVRHHPKCFGCGSENPASLGLEITYDGEVARARMQLDERHEGAPGFVHGGAVASAFDDVLGTLPMMRRTPAVTAKLEVDYRAPLFLGRAYDIEGRIESVDGRKITLAGVARDEQGAIVAESRALFVEVSMEHFAQGRAGTPPW